MRTVREVSSTSYPTEYNGAVHNHGCSCRSCAAPWLVPHGATSCRRDPFDETLASGPWPVYKEHPMADHALSPDVYPAGTILSCPAITCGVRVYRLRTAASFGEVVTNDGVLLRPVNDAIPARKVWDRLACPLCGTALVLDGQLHTAERGWR